MSEYTAMELNAMHETLGDLLRVITAMGGSDVPADLRQRIFPSHDAPSSQADESRSADAPPKRRAFDPNNLTDTERAVWNTLYSYMMSVLNDADSYGEAGMLRAYIKLARALPVHAHTRLLSLDATLTALAVLDDLKSNGAWRDLRSNLDRYADRLVSTSYANSGPDILWRNTSITSDDIETFIDETTLDHADIAEKLSTVPGGAWPVLRDLYHAARPHGDAVRMRSLLDIMARYCRAAGLDLFAAWAWDQIEDGDPLVAIYMAKHLHEHTTHDELVSKAEPLLKHTLPEVRRYALDQVAELWGIMCSDVRDDYLRL